MSELAQAASQLKDMALQRLDTASADGVAVWNLFRELSVVPVSAAEDDTLLVAIRPGGPDPEYQIVTLVRQLLIGSADEIESGVQLQFLMTYKRTETFGPLQRDLKDLTRLGSWAFPTATDFLNFTDGLQAWQTLLTDLKPANVAVAVEDLLK